MALGSNHHSIEALTVTDNGSGTWVLGSLGAQIYCIEIEALLKIQTMFQGKR